MAAEVRFRFREGTQDETIYRVVVDHNEYRLPERFESGDVVLDVGAHIGSFTHAAALRGAGRVYAFEAEPSNFRLAAENLRPYGRRVRVAHRAVWRSDTGPTRLGYHASKNPANTGGGNVWFGGEVPVRAVPFDAILRRVTRGGRRRVRFLKIDCEGAEFPILLTSRLLHLIDEVAGEYHEFAGRYDRHVVRDSIRVDGFGRYTIDELTAVLERAGFEVESSRFGETNIGLFRAVRHAGAAAPPAPRPSLWNILTRRRAG